MVLCWFSRMICIRFTTFATALEVQSTATPRRFVSKAREMMHKISDVDGDLVNKMAVAICEKMFELS